MKKAIFLTSLLTALVATSAFALPNVNTPWDQILSDPAVEVSNTVVLDARLGSIFNVCVDGDMLRSIKPLRTSTDCTTEHSGPTWNHNTTTCTGVGYENVAVPIHQVTTTCLDGGYTGSAAHGHYECTTPGYTQTTIPTTYMVTVGTASYSGSAAHDSFSFHPLFTKPYTLPNCAAAPVPPTPPNGD